MTVKKICENFIWKSRQAKIKNIIIIIIYIYLKFSLPYLFALGVIVGLTIFCL